MLQKTKYTLFGIFIAVLGLWGLAVTLPHTFSSGQVIKASEMNANFNALKNAIGALETEVNSLKAKVATLEGQAAQHDAKLSRVPDGFYALPTQEGHYQWATVMSDGTLNHGYTSDDPPGTPTTSRLGPGEYRVSFVPQGSSGLFATITPNSPSDRYCQLNGINYSSHNVTVRCYDNAGNLADTIFKIAIIQ